jgi:membrane protein involved in colicin uptake
VSLQDLVGRVSFDSKGKALDAEGNVRFERRRGAEADPDANASEANASEANASEANASEANADATPKPSDYDDPQAFLDDLFGERLRSESEAAARGEPGTPGRPELANPADSDEVRSAG